MVSAQNTDAQSQLNGASKASATTITRTGGATTKDEIMSSDNAERSGRANVQEAVRDLAESTGGFLIGESNDLRAPLRHVNEEIASYYELSYNPGIQNYDGSFRKLTVAANRKDLVIHARSGYFALPPEAHGGTGMEPFELPLLKTLSDGKAPQDVKFRAGEILLQPKAEGTAVLVMVEVPLHELLPKTEIGKKMQDVHCSLVALVKDSKGEVVEKLARDRSFQVTPEQLKMGNFLDKMMIRLPAGEYTLESVVMDRQSGKSGVDRSQFSVAPRNRGVAISSLTSMRSYTPNVKQLDPEDPLQFQGGSITPTMELTVKKEPNAVLRLFFTIYQDASISAKPTVEVEFLQGGKSLTKVPMQLPAADSAGRIPYLMTVPAASIPPGNYDVRAVARQGDSEAKASTTVHIEQ